LDDASTTPVGVWPRFTPVADHALLVSFGDMISDDTSAAVIALDRALAAAPPMGLCECVPAFVNLLVDFDPLLTDHAQMRACVQQLLRDPVRGLRHGPWREVEVCYDADFAPDLAAVAQAAGKAIDEVINSHLQADYTVRMYGFAPGYAYLSGVLPAIQVPRKPSAVQDIPAGSVLIAGPQCLVTTISMPTGWSMIGRSPTPIFMPLAREPFLFGVGDRVRFKRVDRARLETRKAPERGLT
jgi:inhibitor of KinA